MFRILKYIPEYKWNIIYVSDNYTDILNKWYELKNNNLVIIEYE